jgi:hypothetical protein
MLRAVPSQSTGLRGPWTSQRPDRAARDGREVVANARRLLSVRRPVRRGEIPRIGNALPGGSSPSVLSEAAAARILAVCGGCVVGRPVPSDAAHKSMQVTTTTTIIDGTRLGSAVMASSGTRPRRSAWSAAVLRPKSHRHPTGVALQGIRSMPIGMTKRPGRDRVIGLRGGAPVRLSYP